MAERQIPVRSIQELSALPLIAENFMVGDTTQAIITKSRWPVSAGELPSSELLDGDILRRTCKLGGETCMKSGCQAPESFQNKGRECSDLNLAGTLMELSLDPESVLMVGVTADNVGFYDEIEDYGATTNELGFKELPGYNAFFARAKDEVALAARLADCGFAAVEMDDAEGEKVQGFVHLTRTNMQGEDALKFTVDEKPAGSFEYFLDEAIKHYGSNKESVNVRVVAAIKSENFVHMFKDQDTNRPEERFPGWFAMGLLLNHTNLRWQPGDRIDPDDQWFPQYREMVRWHIERAGLRDQQINFDDCIDPGDLELGHASNHAGAHGKMPDARDAYIVLPRTLA